MKYLTGHLLVLFCSIAVAGPDYDQLIEDLPKDVIKIIDRKIGCNYWSGEMPNNSKSPEAQGSGRPQMIEENLEKLKCSQLGKDEAAIRSKYKTNKSILKAIDTSARLTPSD